MTSLLSAFSDDLHSSFAPAAAIAAEHGLDGVAIRNVDGSNVTSLEQTAIHKIKETADEFGLRVASVGSQFGRGFHLDNDAEAIEARRALERALSCAEVLDTPLIRIFGLWLRDQEPLSEWSRRPSMSDSIDSIVDLLRPSVVLAERSGAVLMIELEGASYVGTVAEARTVITALDSPAVALCWDVCNGWWSGEDPLLGLELARGLPLVDVQTKDVPAREDNASLPTFGRAVVGEGGVPYDIILPSLIKSGYQGWITAERVHHPLKPEERRDLQRGTVADIEALKRLVAPHKGDHNG
jgi:sugar phosphate isomerase/epimerase